MTQKKTKEIRIMGKEDLQKLTKPQMIDLMGGFMDTMRDLALENQELKNNKKSFREALQEEMDNLEINRKRILTIMEIVNNCSSLLEQRVNDTGQIDLRYVLDDDTKTVANNAIRNGLEQLDTWLTDNNINKLKQDKNENTKKALPVNNSDAII